MVSMVADLPEEGVMTPRVAAIVNLYFVLFGLGILTDTLHQEPESAHLVAAVSQE
jgi:hypothetical protein